MKDAINFLVDCLFLFVAAPAMLALFIASTRFFYLLYTGGL